MYSSITPFHITPHYITPHNATLQTIRLSLNTPHHTTPHLISYRLLMLQYQPLYDHYHYHYHSHHTPIPSTSDPLFQLTKLCDILTCGLRWIAPAKQRGGVSTDCSCHCKAAASTVSTSVGVRRKRSGT